MTFFQKRVYQVVSKIPKGEFLSYRKVAELAGFPKAFRAVGNILNKNRDPKVFCHRVIRSNGEIGGYNSGIKKKISLLKREGMLIRKRRVVL